VIGLHHLTEQYESEQLESVADQGPIIYRQTKILANKTSTPKISCIIRCGDVMYIAYLEIKNLQDRALNLKMQCNTGTSEAYVSQFKPIFGTANGGGGTLLQSEKTRTCVSVLEQVVKSLS
jgi:hypothetical protein